MTSPTNSIFGNLADFQSQSKNVAKNSNANQPSAGVPVQKNENINALNIFGASEGKQLQNKIVNQNQSQKDSVQSNPIDKQDRENQASQKQNQKQGMISQNPSPVVQEIAINSGVQLPLTSSGGNNSISSKSANNKNEEEILKIIADLTKEIDEMKKM